MIYNYFVLALIPCQIWLQFCSILCILYYLWDFFVWVVCERECEDSRHHWRSKEFSQVAREKTTCEVKSCAQHMIGIRRVMTNDDSWFSRVRPSSEILVKHSILLFCHIWYTMSLHTLYIPTLPTYWKECFFREKTLAITLES